jgi:hypothetical protein
MPADAGHGLLLKAISDNQLNETNQVDLNHADQTKRKSVNERYVQI